MIRFTLDGVDACQCRACGRGSIWYEPVRAPRARCDRPWWSCAHCGDDDEPAILGPLECRTPDGLDAFEVGLDGLGFLFVDFAPGEWTELVGMDADETVAFWRLLEDRGHDERAALRDEWPLRSQ